MTKRTLNEESEKIIQSKVTQNSTGNGGYHSGKWTEDEHERFLKAIKIYGNLWKKVRDYVQTRSCAQIRSHCQKYFRRKRNAKLQQLRKTNCLKGMIFLVIEEYYNYASSSNKHTDTILEPRSVMVEENEQVNQLEMSSYHNSELIGLADPPEEEPNDLSLGINRMEMLDNEEALSSEVSPYESDFQLNEVELHGQDSDLSMNNNITDHFLIEY